MGFRACEPHATAVGRAGLDNGIRSVREGPQVTRRVLGQKAVKPQAIVVRKGHREEDLTTKVMDVGAKQAWREVRMKMFPRIRRHSRKAQIRHFFACIGWAALLVACLTTLPANATAPQIRVPYFESVQHPIVIDGSGADWPTEALSNGISFYPGDGNEGSPEACGTTVVQNMTSRADGEVAVHLAHDGGFLYVLAIVQDDILDQRTADNNSNEAWKEDALHLYIDSTNARASNIPAPPISNQTGYEQFGVSTDLNCYTENCDFTTNNTSGAAGPGAEPDQINWLVSVSVQGDGPYTYVFEERIPLTEVPGHNLRTMQPGHSYGFNVEFVDSEEGAYPQGWVFWSSDGTTDAWNCEDLWGTMLLESEAGPDLEGMPAASMWGVAIAALAIAMGGCRFLARHSKQGSTLTTR